MRYVIVVPEAFPYKNELTPSPGLRSYLHYKHLIEQWGWLLKKHSPTPRPQGQRSRRLVITRLYVGKQRAFDIGNLYVGAAIMIDHLVKMGWFRDDTERWLSYLRCRQMKVAGVACVEFVIEDVTASPE